MKKNTALFSTVLVTLALVVGKVNANETIKLGVSFFPFYSADSTKPDLIDAIAPELKANGYDIEKVVFLNYAAANPALSAQEIDGNLIQHQLYMDIFNSRTGADLSIAQPVYHATFAIYSSVYNDLESVAKGETVFIPNDGVNTARALLLLQSAGLIKLAENVTFKATVRDIVENKKSLKIIQRPISATAGAYDEGGRKLAVMYPTFARSLNLSGDAERVFIEKRNDITNAYAVSFAVNTDDINAAKTKAMVEALKSDAVKEYLSLHYSWASTPIN